MHHSSKRPVCLLDWDGTLRKGYVIFDWLEYLTIRNVIDPRHHEVMAAHLKKYNSGESDYNDMATRAVQTFAGAMKGLDPNDLGEEISTFWSTQKRLFDFAEPLINLLRERGIEPVVVTGSPAAVVQSCASDIGISACYGLEFGTDADDLYDGTIGTNTAIKRGKEKIVNQIKKNERTIALSFGDAVSDAPLFDAASRAFAVADGQKACDLELQFHELVRDGKLEVVSPATLNARLTAYGSKWLAEIG